MMGLNLHKFKNLKSEEKEADLQQKLDDQLTDSSEMPMLHTYSDCVKVCD